MNRATKQWKRRSAALCLAAFALLPAAAGAEGGSYLYSYTNRGVIDVSAPQPYLTGTIFDGASLGVELRQPEDLAEGGDGSFYVCDAGVSRIYRFDASFRLVRTIAGFEDPSAPDGKGSFNGPKGICLGTDGSLYVADTGNGRVVILDKDGKLIRIIDHPETGSEVLESTFKFVPLKVLADSSGRLFVLCKDVFEGLLQFSGSGTFVGFMGSNRVVPSAIELLWKKIMTEEQKSKLASFVPVEYTNISLDYQGFIYAVTSVRNVDSPIRRLNPSGNDVLVRSPINGSGKVIGDVLYVAYSDYPEVVTGPSSFVDITSDEYGNYYALDGRRGRVFGYDPDGNLLFVFGEMGTRQKGAVESPSAILYSGGDLYVLDRTLCQIIRFTPTEYTQLIHRAMQAYELQHYEESVALWQQIIRENSYFDLAYVKAGYGLYRLKRYTEAMEYFKIANVKTGYSKAFVEYGTDWMNRHFTAVALSVITGFAGLAAAIWLLRRRRKRKIMRKGAVKP